MVSRQPKRLTPIGVSLFKYKCKGNYSLLTRVQFSWRFGPVETMTNVRTYLNGIDGGVNSDNSPTYQGFGSSSGLIVDHIFCTEFTPEKYSVIKKEYEGVKYISDHYPILGTLTHKIEQEQ